MINKRNYEGVLVMEHTTASGMGQSTGKVILMGEHAVVHHQPAIANSFFRRVGFKQRFNAFMDRKF